MTVRYGGHDSNAPREIVLAILAALLACGSTAWGCFLSSGAAEDAAMFLRYALHLAQGYGLVWNKGAAPLDAITDLLATLLTALGIKAGLSPEQAIRVLGTLAHGATCAMVFAGSRYLFRAPILVAWVSAVFVGFGPAMIYVSSGFPTTIFALTVCICWWFSREMTMSENNSGAALKFAVASFFCGIARPEGFLLSALMLVSVVVYRRKAGLHAVRYFLLVCGLLVVCFLIWRWWYFRTIFPVVVLRKGGLYFGNLVISLRHTVEFTFPFLLPLAAGLLFGGPARREAVNILIPVSGFTVAWIAISNTQNLWGRFQYPILPIIAMSWYGAIPSRVITYPKKASLTAYVALGITLSCLSWYYWNHLLQVSAAARKNMTPATRALGRMLQKYASKGYTIATSEAGYLPFYSEWRAIDTFGLHDRAIATDGVITEQLLLKEKPEVIMFNRNPIGGNDLEEPLEAQWFRMTEVLECYAVRHGYLMVARFFGQRFGSEDYYFVRPDFPDATAIANIIAKTKYVMYGSQFVNLANAQTLQDIRNRCPSETKR